MGEREREAEREGGEKKESGERERERLIRRKINYG